MSGRGGVAGVAAAVARTLLLLYPTAFRTEMGCALVRDVRRRAAERGSVPAALWLPVLTLSLLANAAGAWRDALPGGRRSSPPGRWEGVVRGLRHAARGLRRSPGFSLVVVLTLALGIGGTTAVFSVVRAVLVEPLPYAEPGRLVRLYQPDLEAGELEGYVSAPHFRGWRERLASFEEVAALYDYREVGADLRVGERPERVRVLPVSAGYLETLRAAPLRGRTFTRGEEDGSRVAVLSEGLEARLGAAGTVKTVELDGEPYAVVGVMPAGFEDPVVGAVDAWVPVDLTAAGADEVENYFLSVVGRLAPGVDPATARAETAALDAALREAWGMERGSREVRLVALQEDLVSHARPTLLLLLGAVLVVLLVACVNVANLLVVRSLGRVREMALRAALGGGRRGVAGQLLAESLLLAGVGGVLGVALAAAGVDALLVIGGDAVPRAGEGGVDGPVLAFAAGVSVLTGVLFGLGPALRAASRLDPAAALRASTRGGTDSRRVITARGGLVAAQVGLALVLVLGASTLAASVYRLSRVELGMRTSDVLTFEVNLPPGRYDAGARAAFHRELTERLSELPGVSGAGAVSRLPATGTYHSWSTRSLTGSLAGVEGRSVPGEQRVVEGGYFAALGIDLLEGRVFDERDEPGAVATAVLGRRTAERLFPGISPLGQEVRAGGQTRVVVGVVEDVALDVEGAPAPYVYHDHAQFADNRNWPLTYVVAATGPPSSFAPAVRATLADMDPSLVMHRVATLDDVLGGDGDSAGSPSC